MSEEQVKDKAEKPRGLMPKNLQGFVIAGIALVMVLIMALTGHKHPPGAAASAVSPSTPDPLPVNREKVAALKHDIQQKQQESAPQVEQSLLEQQKRLAAQGQIPAPNLYGTPVSAAYPNGAYPLGAYAAAPSTPSTPPPADPVKEEQKKREYLSLFADNVALTYRKDAPGLHDGASRSTSQAASASAVPPAAAPDPFEAQAQLLAQTGAQLAHQEQMLQRAQQAGLLPPGPLVHPLPPPMAQAKAPTETAAGQQQQTEPEQEKAEKQKPANPDVPRPGAFNAAEGKKYVVFEGTILETLSVTRLDGSFSGPVTCMLSDNIYSQDRQRLLIPAGSKVLGEAKKVETLGQVRLAVFFHRLIMPDGYSVSLDQFKGLDQEGATALKDKVNNHYMKIFGASLAIGVLGAGAELGTGGILTQGGTDRIREGFGIGMSRAGERILDRFLNILPTVTIREGTRVKVYLSNDLLLPDYNQHRMPSDL